MVLASSGFLIGTIPLEVSDFLLSFGHRKLSSHHFTHEDNGQPGSDQVPGRIDSAAVLSENVTRWLSSWENLTKERGHIPVENLYLKS